VGTCTNVNGSVGSNSCTVNNCRGDGKP
jgi:hypothetical protein